MTSAAQGTTENRWATLWLKRDLHAYITRVAELRGQSFNRCALELLLAGIEYLSFYGKLYPGQKPSHAPDQGNAP